MKKLFSAATSLIMAASAIASSVVPFATGAADASKSFEIRAFEGASTTISKDAIAAGDVTVPVGIYLTEGANDSQSIVFQMTVQPGSSSADPSDVSFAMVTGGAKVNAEAKDYVIGGETYSTDVLISFCSNVKVNKKGAVTAAMPSTPQVSTAESNKTAGTDYAYAGFAWIPPTSGGYSWTGEKSDSFPVAVVNVTFPKGTKEGTYSLDFCDYATDAAHPENKSCMIESGDTKYTTDNSNLTLKGLDIVIGDSSTEEPKVTTTAEPTPDVVTTTTVTDGGSDVKPGTEVEPGYPSEAKFEKVSDFVIDMNNGGKGYTFTLDEIKAKPSFYIDAKISEMGSHSAAMLIAKPGTNPAGIEVSFSDEACYALEPKVWEDKGGTFYCNVLQDTGAPSSASDFDLGEAVISLDVAVDASTIKPGTYTYTFARFDVSEDGSGSKEVSPLVIPAVITITDGESTETDVPVTTTTTTQAPAVQTTTTTTQAPAAQTTTTTTDSGSQDKTTTETPVGDVLYGDANDNKVVNIADVVVLNKWLNNADDYNMTAQGKVNADCCDPKAGAEINASDSDAIIRSIVHRITLPTTSADLKADQAKD